MKWIYTFAFLTVSLLAFCQSNAIKNLEAVNAKLMGEEYLMNALQLSEWYYNEGFYEKSAERAENAYSSAKKLNRNSNMALALHRQGKANMAIPNKKNTFKAKAYKNFSESNALTTDAKLKIENLTLMKDLALALDKRKDLDRIVKDLALLTGEGSQASEKVAKLDEQNKQLNAAVSELNVEQEKLRQQQESLTQMVGQKEAAIRNMTDEQIRRELLLSERGRLLDSLAFTSRLDSLEIAQKELLVSQQQSELDKAGAELKVQATQQYFLMAVAALGLLLALGLFSRYQAIRRHNSVLAEKNRIIEAERKRSEELLLNILPVAVAEELKKNGSAIARHYDNATVLFTDFEGFSNISKNASPAKLVSDLDHAFKNFDRIIGKYGLEKIKTIGDSYMCAGGLPADDEAQPVSVVRAALEIQQFLLEWNREKAAAGEPPFLARIGIHTGPLVAGVVGSKKFAYDIWGDTVNVASRMESSGQPGRVNISASTFSYVKHIFDCEYRGKVPAKNVGEIDMYFVKERLN